MSSVKFRSFKSSNYTPIFSIVHVPVTKLSILHVLMVIHITISAIHSYEL